MRLGESTHIKPLQNSIRILLFCLFTLCSNDSFVRTNRNEWSQNLMEKPSQEQQQQQQALKCPRCDSSNTKFCYYNNYSLSQPRHFCKSCKRYWTRGGTLRNVPVGGGCRKNKRVKRPTSSSSSPLSSTSSTHHVNNNNNNNNPLFYGLANDVSADIINFPYQPCLSDFPNKFNPLLSSYSNMFGFSSSSTPTIASLLASTLNQHKIINGGSVKNTEPLALPPFLDQLEQIGWSTNMGSWHDPTTIGFGSSVTSLI